MKKDCRRPFEPSVCIWITVDGIIIMNITHRSLKAIAPMVCSAPSRCSIDLTRVAESIRASTCAYVTHCGLLGPCVQDNKKSVMVGGKMREKFREGVDRRSKLGYLTMVRRDFRWGHMGENSTDYDSDIRNSGL